MFARLSMALLLAFGLTACGLFGGDDDPSTPPPLETEDFGEVHSFTIGLPTNAIFKKAHRVGKDDPEHQETENGFKVYYGETADTAASGFSLYVDVLEATEDVRNVMVRVEGIPDPEAVAPNIYGRAYRSDIGFDTVEFAARYGDHIYRACILFVGGIIASDLEAFPVLGSQDKELADFFRRFEAFYRSKYPVFSSPEDPALVRLTGGND